MALEERTSNIRALSRLAALVGAILGLFGVFLLYVYVWVAFSDMPTRIQWWAVISIVLSMIFILGYVVAADTIRSLEREQRRKLTEK
jgi:hypothetical protein